MTKIISDFAWDVYNFVKDYIYGKYGIVPLQEALDKHFKSFINSKGYNKEDEMVEGLVEEKIDTTVIPNAVYTSEKDIKWTTEFNLPEGYEFRDENGNIINASKIVLEKKKPKYPQSYKECCKIVNAQWCGNLMFGPHDGMIQKDYNLKLMEILEPLRKLLICRDAYWQIANWKPDWRDDVWNDMYYISFDGKNIDKEIGYPCCNMILIFPTLEMRDAFYENFKELIEECKELL